MAELSTDNTKLGDNFTGSYCFWESRFTLGLNDAKNTAYIKKCFKQNTAAARISRRWPLAVFFAMLDIGGINVTVFYRPNKDKEVTRCAYLRNLARSLVMEQVQHRLTSDQTPVEVKN